MMDKKAIILIIVLVVAVGLLGFSIYFYLTRTAEVVEVRPETATTPQDATDATRPVDSVAIEGWEEVIFQAKINKDVSRCNQISNALAKSECEDAVNILIANEGDDINLCRAINNAASRDNCYRVIGTRKGVDYCKYLTIRENREACEAGGTIDAVIAGGDVNKCFELEENQIDACVTQFIINFNSSQDCNQINDEEYLEICKGAF